MLTNSKGKSGSWKRFISGLAVMIGITSAQKSSAAGLLIADGGFGGELEIVEQEVDVTINNGIAVIDVVQVFKNLEDRQVEALYTFPVPGGASVSNFSMWINGKEMIGEVLEKERARKIYNSYKAKRRDPGLLEQKDYKTFEMRIFPINAKAEQKVKLTYYQELDVDHNWATFVYPLATSTQNMRRTRTEGKFSIDVNVKSEIPIKMMESTSHPQSFAIANHSENYSQASLEVQKGDLNKDVVIAYQLKRPKTGFDIITSKQDNEDGYFCLSLTAGEEIAQRDVGMDFMFILDISGSMRNGGKMQMSRESIGAFVKALDPMDRFELMSFNVSSKALFNKMSAVNDINITSATEFLNQQSAVGGTDLRPAMTAAMKYSDPDRPLNLVILSDGMTEQGTRRELMEQISSRPANTRVFCIGVGNDVNRPLLRQMATEAGGLAAFISKGDNFERQAKAFKRKLMRPAVADLKVQFSNNIYDVEPKVLPNLYHGMPVRIYGRYKSGGDVDVKLTGNVGSFGFKQETTVQLPKEDSTNPEIDRMWAWHKMQRLNDMVENGSNDQSIKNEIIRLGEGYSIASEYTSFLVLENDAEYKRWKIKQVNATRIAKDRASQLKLRKELDKIRANNQLGPAVGDKVEPQKQHIVQKSPQQTPTRQVPVKSRKRNRRSFDFKLPSGGGGAVDPISGILLLGFAGVALYSKPKK